MRKIFSEKEIDAYINGEDLDNVDMLESNPYFMSAVIRKSKDYGIYDVYCNDKIKVHPVILKTMLELFGDDYLEKDGDRFYKGLNMLSRKTISIDNFYSNDNPVNTQFLELLILLFGPNGSESDVVNDYFEAELKPYTDEYGAIVGDCKGLFASICTKYNSDIVQEFFAVKLTDKIISDVFYDGIDPLSYKGVENIVHRKVADKNLLDEEMVICSIIGSIAETDSTLADYLSDHKELLKDYGKYYTSYIKYWDSYESEKTYNVTSSFVKLVERYMVDHQIYAASEDIVKAIGRKYGLESIFNDYYERFKKEIILDPEENEYEFEMEFDRDKYRRKMLETYRDMNNAIKADLMIDTDIFKPILSLARRTFNVDTDNKNKVFSLSAPITGAKPLKDQKA